MPNPADHEDELFRSRSDDYSIVSSPQPEAGTDPCDGDTELQNALEVVFDERNAHRRKSSLIPTDHPSGIFHKKNTDCYLHKLLESQQRHGASTDGMLDDIVELAGEQPSKSTPAAPKVIREGLNHIVGNSTPGQEDERSWREHHAGQVLAKNHLDKVNAALQDEQSAVRSRLLTKKQLSDMAWGVRELSKRLGSVRLKLRVKTVFLLTKAHDESLIAMTRELARWLLSPERDVRYVVYVEDNFKANKKFNEKGILEEIEKLEKENISSEANGNCDTGAKNGPRLRYWTEELCRTKPHTFDFVVTLGGDGTVLYASWLFQGVVPPVLSFALGSLGFLTKFDFADYPTTLEKAFKEGVTISLRLRFEGTVMRSQGRKRIADKDDINGDQSDDSERKRDLIEELIGEEKDDEMTHRPDGTYEILNDIVVDRGPNPTMSSTELFGDDEHFTSIQADGICVATPTGSTAYNLAAGGSLCHPENPVILVTAICAHTLSFRPIILPDTIVLRIGVPYDARTSSWASFDGRERVELHPGDYVTISASRFPFANVMPQGRRSEDWINSISGKLGWNTRQRQKGFKEWSG
ncbi:ATP-NAD kinase-like domain-containing protein [Xylogone sp. PMI_703]|nr:ATP-NAD kinase-like domain-containing protein [Xylogone sp. PMI_703]